MIVIDYNPKSGRFVITAPIWANGVIRDIPNRKFETRTKSWSAPATRLNVNYMASELGAASWTRPALMKLSEVKANVGKVIAPALPFPFHYQFKTQPFRTQKLALEKAFGRSSFAFYKDMGTGKSKTFIDLACASRVHPLIESVLMVCPIGVRKNWVREVEIHSPLPADVYLLNSAKPKEFEKWLNTPHDFKWLIVGVESLGISKNAYEMMLQFILKNPRTMFCVDESHKIKNHAALRSQRCHAAARHTPYRVVMTGTPIAKGVMDLYSQFQFLDPDIMGVGDYYSFRGRYAEMGGHEDKEIIGYKNLDELMEIVNPFVYQVRKEEALPDLPPKMRTKRYVTLNADQTRHYKSMVKDKIVISDDNRTLTVKNALGKALRLQQIAGGFVPFETHDPFADKMKVVTEPIKGKNPKIEDLLEFCDEIDGSLIVWCAFRPELDAVAAALREKYGPDDVVEVHGGISEDQRDINVNELFQKKKATKLVANVQTGGTGLTMTAAEYEYFFSNTHNSIDREQGEDRAHRKGQLKSVLIVDCIAQIETSGTAVDCIDATVVASLEAKKDLSEYIRGEIDRLAAQGIKDLSSIFGV